MEELDPGNVFSKAGFNGPSSSSGSSTSPMAGFPMMPSGPTFMPSGGSSEGSRFSKALGWTVSNKFES